MLSLFISFIPPSLPPSLFPAPYDVDGRQLFIYSFFLLKFILFLFSPPIPTWRLARPEDERNLTLLECFQLVLYRFWFFLVSERHFIKKNFSNDLHGFLFRPFYFLLLLHISLIFLYTEQLLPEKKLPQLSTSNSKSTSSSEPSIYLLTSTITDKLYLLVAMLGRAFYICVLVSSPRCHFCGCLPPVIFRDQLSLMPALLLLLTLQ